jgi:hypothetical protein
MSARGRIEALLDALSGAGPWCYDGGLSALLDQAVLVEERHAG